MLKLHCILCCTVFLSQAKKLCLCHLCLIDYTKVFLDLFLIMCIVADDTDVCSLLLG